jgi:hypothetical protein
VWLMDFMSDLLKGSRPVRTVNVLDLYNRESLVIDVDFSLSAQRVIRPCSKSLSAEENLLPLAVIMSQNSLVMNLVTG